MHLQTMWHEFAAQQGNAPGAQQGDVVVTFTQPIGGETEVTLPSKDVSLAAEAGNLLGVQLTLPDGRRLFAMASSVVGIVDAPLDGRAREARDKAREQDKAEAQEREQEDADLEARIPAANRTPEQAERAAKREQAAGQAERAQDREQGERERKRAAEQDAADRQRQADQAKTEETAESAAAHDKAEAAHDKGEAAEDKAAARRRPGR
jgi:hypothetical protein